MKLSDKAKEDLRKVLGKDIGKKATANLNDEDINVIGDLLLTILAESIKMKSNKV